MSSNAARLAARTPVDPSTLDVRPIDLPPEIEVPDRWQTVDEAVDQFLSWFDGNDNGTVTVTEIAAAVHPGGRDDAPLNAVVRRLVDLMDPNDDGQLTATDVTAALETLDTNEDGALTPADLGRELAHEGLTPVLAVMLQGGPIPGPKPRENGVAIDDVVASMLDRFDGNGNGALTLSELLAELDPRGHRQKLQDVLTSLVGAVDTNDDGAMSEAELTAAVSSLDANGNGRLDRGDNVQGPGSADEVDLVGVLLPKFRHFDGAGPDAG
jgi:Ca2+-binding EF-hand superfamily protein